MENFRGKAADFLATAAIVCEYNPFHRGHQLQFFRTRQLLGVETAIVCLMSGNYVQRGAPAVFDKFVRAQAAVCCGANLVLELPLHFAIQSAEGFAAGAVEILSRLGGIDTLCFGAECGDTKPLKQVVACLESSAFPPLLREKLSHGISFPAARQQAVEQLCGLGQYLRQPNNILGIEYCKALFRRNSAIAPLAIQRESGFASAAEIRAQMGAGAWQTHLPPEAVQCFFHAIPHQEQWGERAMLARLRCLPDEAYAALPYGSEGLWHKVADACRRAATLEEIFTLAHSKRYPRTRLQRMVLCAYLGISNTDLAQPAPHTRVLAFDETGRALLRKFRTADQISIINAGERSPDAAYNALEQRAADLYTLFAAPGAPTPAGTEQAGRIFYRKKSEKTACISENSML